MKSGIGLIAIERREQIEKHGYDKNHDKTYVDGDLAEAAAHLISVMDSRLFMEQDIEGRPEGWDEEIYRKMMLKPYKERLAIAGALIAAELDRLLANEDPTTQPLIHSVQDLPTIKWAKIKDFANTLTESQLQQDVKVYVSDNETPVEVFAADPLGEDHYSFPDYEYGCGESCFDKDCIPDEDGNPKYQTLEQAIAAEEYYVTGTDRVYLYAE